MQAQQQQQQQQQQMLNKSKDTLQRAGNSYHGPAAVQLPTAPPTGVVPTRLVTKSMPYFTIN
jgi:hypothetical protein